MSLKLLRYRDHNPVIREFFYHNRENGRDFTIKHLVANFGMAERTVQRILKKIEEDPSDEAIECVACSGRPCTLNPRHERAILQLENKKASSTRRAAGDYGVLQRSIQHTLHRQDATCPKRKNAPDTNV